ncbi:helix-turn-helix domain-containing protein [Paenibacillus odorifer]|uniref:helix-turn-helix domain-containing protein n=1 Tax=Paenibacillus odorifer TaxID=189426 RepID=UPI0009D6769F|nr:helix-turn-helix transcriptional regulator [Paenibacillus odorifer]
MEKLLIRCRLGDIMKERGLSNKDIVDLTGVSRNTITSLAANATKRIDYDTLGALCQGLRVLPGDILEYIEDNAPVKRPHVRTEVGGIKLVANEKGQEMINRVKSRENKDRAE